MWLGVLDLFKLVRATARYPFQNRQPYMNHPAARLVDNDIFTITYVHRRSPKETKGSFKPQNVESPEPPLFNQPSLPPSLQVPDHRLYNLLCNLDTKKKAEYEANTSKMV